MSLFIAKWCKVNFLFQTLKICHLSLVCASFKFLLLKLKKKFIYQFLIDCKCQRISFLYLATFNYRVSHETWQYAGRLECRLDFWYDLLLLFVNLILEVNNHKITLVLPFQKCGLPFLCFQYCPRYEEFRSDFDNFAFI